MVSPKFTAFFDKPSVVRSVAAGTRRVLSKAGAFIRTNARSRIRKRKRVARPGEAPSDHGGALKRLLFFAYDKLANSVVVGPLLFRRQNPPAPRLLEMGGAANHWRTGTPSTYSRFPYMEPALEEEQPKFPELFTNSVK